VGAFRSVVDARIKGEALQKFPRVIMAILEGIKEKHNLI
jgi:hypothetical protein